MASVVAVFAKVAHPGRVKTRLSPPLTAQDAAAFHLACVLDTWAAVKTLPNPFLYCDGPWPSLAIRPVKPVQIQQGGPLGERMYRCFQDLQAEGFDRLLIVGSDSPTLPPEYLAQALESLETHDAVLGPSDDGGYYAVGCRQPAPGMFDGVPWSTPETLRATERNFEALGWRVHRLPTWYDVDTIADLRRLAGEARLPENTGRWISAHRRYFSDEPDE